MTDVSTDPDSLFRNYDEARHWVQDADLRSQPIVLADHFDGEHVQTAVITGGHDRYDVHIKSHEEGGTSRTTVDATEVAEMMGGWTVAGRVTGGEIASIEDVAAEV